LGIVVAGKGPADLCEAVVDAFAVIDLGGADFAGRRTPAGTGAYGVGGAVLIEND
jgi:hypothetical protein